MKLTKNTNMETLKAILKDNLRKAKKANKSLGDQIQYAMKHEDKATKKDLFDLAESIKKVLGDSFVMPVMAEEKSVETKAKPKSEQALKPKKKESKKTEEAEETAKKPANKAGVEKFSFSKTLEIGDTTYEVAKIKSLKELYQSLEDEEDIIVAFYYSKDMIKEFGYFDGYLGTPKSFDNDLDITSVVYVSDENRVAYCVSQYTEVPYTLLPEDFKGKDGVKVAGICEFEIYKAQ